MQAHICITFIFGEQGIALIDKTYEFQLSSEPVMISIAALLLLSRLDPPINLTASFESLPVRLAAMGRVLENSCNKLMNIN